MSAPSPHPTYAPLVDHAYQLACKLPEGSRSPTAVFRELTRVAPQDPDVLYRAWDHCLERYVEQEELAWLRAACWFLALLYRARRESDR